MISFVNRSVLLILIFIILILSIKFKVDYKIENRFAPPPIGITKLTFGFTVVLADIFWVRSLQGFDYCEVYSAPNVCESKSWLYKNLSVMFTLDPNMQAGFYHTGALALSIVISDIAGASEIFDLGVRKHPKDWKLQASNDGTTWTTIDTRAGESFASRFQTRRFEVSAAPQPYTYYRIFMTANGGSSLFQMAEWRVIRYD